MRIYPNPTNVDFITIQSSVIGEKHVKLYDINGRLVLNKNLSSDYLNVRLLEPGIYFVNVTIDGKISTSKLIIK